MTSPESSRKYSILHDIEELRQAYRQAGRFQVIKDAYSPRRQLWTWLLYVSTPLSIAGFVALWLAVYEVIDLLYLLPALACSALLPLVFHKVLGVIHKTYDKPGSKVIRRQGLKMTAARYFMFRKQVDPHWAERYGRLEDLLDIAGSTVGLQRSIFSKHLIVVVLVAITLALLNGGARWFWTEMPVEAGITLASFVFVLIYTWMLSWMFDGLMLTAAYREREFLHFLKCLSVDLKIESEPSM